MHKHCEHMVLSRHTMEKSVELILCLNKRNYKKYNLSYSVPKPDFAC